MRWLSRVRHERITGSAAIEGAAPQMVEDAAAQRVAARQVESARVRREVMTGARPAEMSAVRAIDHDGEVVHVSISFDDDLVVATSTANPDTTYAGRTVSPGGASFPRSGTQPYALEVSVWRPDGLRQRVVVDDVPIAFPLVQSLPDGGLLVVGARAQLIDDTAEHNALIVDETGAIGETFCIGDGVQALQVTPSGQVWAGYHDEGVFGNFGWGVHRGHAPLGSHGLVRWSLAGERLYEFEPPDGLGPIDDCYAMCADGETVWTCFYSDFPICRLGADGATTGWLNDTAGAGLIAVYEDRVALIGGYNGLFDRLVLCELGDSIVERPSTWQLVLPGGDDLPAGAWMAARGRYIHALCSNTWFRLDIAALRC
jgi:hypothetical protein